MYASVIIITIIDEEKSNGIQFKHTSGLVW